MRAGGVEVLAAGAAASAAPIARYAMRRAKAAFGLPHLGAGGSRLCGGYGRREPDGNQQQGQPISSCS